MSRIIDVFRWEYGVKRRHWLLLIAAAFAGADLYIVNLTGSAPLLLTIAAFCAPFFGVWAVLQASVDEQITIAAWSGVGCIGFGIVTLGLHSIVASQIPLSQFQQTHPVGLAFTTVVSVVGVLFGVTLMIGVVNSVWRRRMGGDGGGTPEERVLSEEEYADFEPIRDDTQPANSPQLGVSTLWPVLQW